MEDLTKAIIMIRKYEGCVLTAYRDIVGVWTIGWGSTLGVKPGMTITQAQADGMLNNDVQDLWVRISKAVTVPINNNQVCALIDFSYNLGFGALFHSELLTLLNGGSDKVTVAEQFLRWDHAGGVVVAGLTARRKEEASLFLSTSA